jgi:uncharacterized membrane protein
VTALVTAAAVWIGIHTFISGGPMRARLVAQIGDRLYRGGFALISIASLIVFGLAYASTKPTQPVDLPLWVVVGLAAWQLVASLFIVAGLSTRNPGTSGLDHTIADRAIVRGMLRVTRHPFLWGVAMWSVAHLLVRYDAANFILFGSIGYVALAGTLSIDRKRSHSLGPAWMAFADATSNVPFLAIAEGRQRLPFNEIGLMRVACALILWLVVIWVHPSISGGKPLLAIL